MLTLLFLGIGGYFSFGLSVFSKFSYNQHVLFGNKKSKIMSYF